MKKERSGRVGLFGGVIGVLWCLMPMAALADDGCDWSPADCWYGDGSGGNHTVPPGVTLILTGDANYRNLTVSVGATVKTQGHVLRVCDTLTLENNAEITDTLSGGDGGPGGGGLGEGQNPYGDEPCKVGACGHPGQPPSAPQAGKGGAGGAQGSGAGGAQWLILPNRDADGGWCDNCGGADQNDKGVGGDGGRGGGYVRVWAFNVNNAGAIHAGGEDGQNGGQGGDGEYYCWGCPQCGDVGFVCKDLAGGGQGGGAAGDGGEGGTLELYHPRPNDPLGLYHANGGQYGSGGPGGEGGEPPGGGCLKYGVAVGYKGPGCGPTCCEDCEPRPCWDRPGCNPCGGRGGDGEWRDAYCAGDGDDGDSGCDGPDGTASHSVTRPGDYDGDGDEDLDDYCEWVDCFPLPNGGPVPAPECEVFDFDCDGDIDCDDWDRFKIAWSGPLAELPCFRPCDVCCPPRPEPYSEPCVEDSQCPNEARCIGCVCYAPRNRYLAFLPDYQDDVVALRVKLTACSLFPSDVGATWWVGEPFPGFDYPDDSVARLVDTPVWRIWGEPVIYLGDCPIVPGSSYDIQAICEGGDPGNEGAYSVALTLPTARVWGDICGLLDEEEGWLPPDGNVTFDDIVCAIQVFEHSEYAPHWTWADLDPETPNTVINMSDIFRIVQAFEGGEYPFPAPTDCPEKARTAKNSRGERMDTVARATPTSLTCPPKPQPDRIVGLLKAPDGAASKPTISMTAGKRSVRAGESVHVYVHATGNPNLGAYEVALDVSSGTTGTLILDDLLVDVHRNDFVFANVESLQAVDTNGGRLGSAALTTGVDVSEATYLATFVFRASADASGTFLLNLRSGLGTFMRDSSGAPIPFERGPVAEVAVEPWGSLSQTRPRDG